MLPRVLLQHLQPSRPINHTCHYLPDLEGYVAFQVMQHTTILSHGNCRHPCCIDCPCIVWLPTTARVEGGLIEHHHTMAVLDKTVHHLSGKLGKVGIVPVEFRGHKSIHGLCEVKDVALPGIG